MSNRRRRNLELLRQAATGCKESRDTLIVDLGGIVSSAVEQVLGTYQKFKYLREDLLGFGFVYLVQVVDQTITRTDLHVDDFNVAAYIHRAIEHDTRRNIRTECPSVFNRRFPTQQPLTGEHYDGLFDNYTEYQQYCLEAIEEAEVHADFGDVLAVCLQGSSCGEYAKDSDVPRSTLYMNRDRYKAFYKETYLAN